MPPLRSAKVTYIAAFLLGAVIAFICVSPMRSAEMPGRPDVVLTR